MKFSKLVVAMFISLIVPTTQAGSVGVIGPTYPIGEESALDMIMKKLREKERSGELKKLQEEAIRRSINGVKNMKPVDGISTVQSKAQRLIDPTVNYTKSITTDDGRVVVPAGTRINPLEIVPFTKKLIFFDGRDPEQREAVGRMLKTPGNRIKPILVAGSWFDLT